MLAQPVLDMKAKLGPNLVSHVKQVTPGALLAVHKIFMPLNQSGCGHLVLQSKKVLVSLHTTVAQHNIGATGHSLFFLAGLDTCSEGPNHAMCSNDENFEKLRSWRRMSTSLQDALQFWRYHEQFGCLSLGSVDSHPGGHEFF